MVISERLRAIREQKELSQGDIEERTGLKRCYVSRVEKRSHHPEYRDTRKNGPRSRNSHVPAFLRWGSPLQSPGAPAGPVCQ